MLVPFLFDSHTVRVIAEDAGETLFVARDVAAALGYARPNDAINQHCRGTAEYRPISDALGRPQESRVIREPDLYRLIFGSSLSSAQEFERLVVEEILPSIRKTGAYAPVKTPGEHFLEMAQNFLAHERELAAQAKTLTEHGKQILALEASERDMQARVAGVIADSGFVSILGWCKLRGLRVPTPEMAGMGRRATQHCNTFGIRVGTVRDQRWGEVHAYPIEVLDYLFGEYCA